MRSALLISLLAFALALTACGDAEELSREDAQTLKVSRTDLDDALDTEETLRTSKEEATKLRAKVQRIVGKGYFENDGKPDEFGLAALGELRELVPSLVLERGDSVVALDAPATRGFLANAVDDPPEALSVAAKSEVDSIVKVTEADDVGSDTKVRGDQTVSAYLTGVERDVRPVWPRLAARLKAAREEL